MRTAFTGILITIALGLGAAPRRADAEPLVRAGGKPGAARAWKTTAKGLILELEEGYDAEDVAQAVSAMVPDASAKAERGRVLVTTSDPAGLLARLEAVDVEPLLADVNDMLSALRSEGKEEGSGSSIRARQSLDLTGVIGDEDALLLGRVLEVDRVRYPFVLVTLEVTRAPGGQRLPKKGERITVIPLVRLKNGRLAPEDRASQLNAGAWYTQPGDRVRVRLGKRRKEGWIARAFQRSKP